jgi:hypothetical protein
MIATIVSAARSGAAIMIQRRSPTRVNANMKIDSQEASAALAEVDAIMHRVRQSRSYRLSSSMMVLWGVLVAAGNVVTHFWPPYARAAWIGVYVVGVAGSIAMSGLEYSRSRTRTFDWRILAAYLFFFAFGFLWTEGLVQLTPRQLGAFWPTYFMLGYAIAGLWFGLAFVAIGLAISALTLLGYFYAGPWFVLWMALVNGGGLVLCGLWMRRN